MGTFYRRQLPTAKRTRKRQGRFRRRGVNRDGRGAFGGWVLSAVMDKKKEGRPFRAGPLLVRLYESLPCRCSYTIAHFAVVVNNFLVAAGAFVGCCIRVACGRPLEVRSRPRAGGGGLLLALLPYRPRRCAQRAAWPSFGRAVSVHAGGPRAAALSARVGFPLPDDFGRLWGFCGCRRDWAEPIGAARCSRGDARDKKGP